MMDSKRYFLERIHKWWMNFNFAFIFILPLIIFSGLITTAWPLLKSQTIQVLIFSENWFPQQGKFGLLTFLIGSILVTGISFILSAPICLLTAIYLTQYAPKKIRHPFVSVVDVMAGIPSVIYGVWGIMVIVPFVSQLQMIMYGKTSSGYSLLAGALVLSIMSIPFILHILIEVFDSLPQELKAVSLSLGANRWETIKYVLLKKGFIGIVSAFSLGISKSFGETIAVLMVVGNVAQIPKNVFDAVYPLPSLIANNYGEMLSIPSYDSALMFAALLLLLTVIIFHIFSKIILQGIGKNME